MVKEAIWYHRCSLYSLTKYSAIVADVKGYFGIDGCNNQLGNVEIPASVESIKCFGICVDRSNRNNQLGSGRICVDRSGCNNQLVVVDADLDEEAVKVCEANGLDEIDEANVADRTNLADEASKTSLADAGDTCSLRTRKYVLNNQPALRD